MSKIFSSICSDRDVKFSSSQVYMRTDKLARILHMTSSAVHDSLKQSNVTRRLCRSVASQLLYTPICTARCFNCLSFCHVGAFSAKKLDVRWPMAHTLWGPPGSLEITSSLLAQPSFRLSATDRLILSFLSLAVVTIGLGSAKFQAVSYNIAQRLNSA